jgi:RES domain-containing protein
LATFYRLASAGPDWDECDLTGQAAKAVGGRWNDVGTPMVYAASSIALAVLETVVHLGAGGMVFNRYLVAIDIPAEVYRRREVMKEPPEAWDSIPPSFKSKQLGSAWVRSQRGLLLDVPSVVVPQERNLLINPLHAAIGRLKAINLARFVYDPRLARRG